jgi:hypothetical protein
MPLVSVHGALHQLAIAAHQQPIRFGLDPPRQHCGIHQIAKKIVNRRISPGSLGAASRSSASAFVLSAASTCLPKPSRWHDHRG